MPEIIRIECATRFPLTQLACCGDCCSKTEKLPPKVPQITTCYSSSSTLLFYLFFFVIVANNTAVDNQRDIVFYLFIFGLLCYLCVRLWVQGVEMIMRMGERLREETGGV